MGTVDTHGALASGLAVASVEYVELLELAAHASSDWAEVLSQLGDLPRIGGAEKAWQRFAASLLKLRASMAELGEHVEKQIVDSPTQVRARIASGGAR